MTPHDSIAELAGRLREHASIFGDHEQLMSKQWDMMAKLLREGGHGSLPRDMFEALIDGLGDDLQKAVSALERLQREREAVEEAVYGRHDRGFIMRPLIDPPPLPEAVEELRKERDDWFREAEDRANSCSLVIRERDEAVERAAQLAENLTGYTGEGTEDRNDGFGMFARGVRFAKRTIAANLRALSRARQT